MRVPVDIEVLPELLRDLARNAGIQPALTLAEWRGGTPLYTPNQLDEEHEIARRLGTLAARWLVDRHGGNYAKVPRARVALRAARCADHCRPGGRHECQRRSAEVTTGHAHGVESQGQSSRGAARGGPAG